MNFSKIEENIILFFDLKSVFHVHLIHPFWANNESSYFTSRYLFFSFFPALLHCSLLLLLNTLPQSLAFIYIFIYIYIYNSTVNDDKTCPSLSSSSCSLSLYNRKRRERSHQSINSERSWLVIRKKISKSPTHLNKQDINKYVSTNNVWNLLETILDRVRVTRGIGRSFRFGPSFWKMSVQEK